MQDPHNEERRRLATAALAAGQRADDPDLRARCAFYHALLFSGGDLSDARDAVLSASQVSNWSLCRGFIGILPSANGLQLHFRRQSARGYSQSLLVNSDCDPIIIKKTANT